MQEYRDEIIRIADQYVGTKEHNRSNVDKDGVIESLWEEWEDSRVSDHIGPGYAWCAIFVSAVYAQSGLALDHVHGVGFSYVPFFVKFAKETESFTDDVSLVKPGDIIFYSERGLDRPDHIGIVERIEGGWIHTIEGNCNDSVSRRQVTINGNNIVGFSALE